MLTMPLSSASPRWQHVFQNLSLIALALVVTPYCFIAVAISWLYTQYRSKIKGTRSEKDCNAQPRRILVTGVGMVKGLTIARAFHLAGHHVVAADFEPYGVPVCGRFSSAVQRFYRLPQISETAGEARYVRAIVSIVRKENIDLWISCSGVATSLADAAAAEAVEKFTNCKAIQFGVDMTRTLHEKFLFIENTKELGLNVPETHLVTSIDDAQKVLHPEAGSRGAKFIMKPVGVDDTTRSDMTLLPRPSFPQTLAHISRLRPSPLRPFVLQQFIQGPEYCTHSLVIRGQVLLFVACRSADMLMHYQALQPESSLFQAMLKYTQDYATAMGKDMTGHFSLDFLVAENPNSTNAEDKEDLAHRIYPIECNPRAHTAVILFRANSSEMVTRYLHALSPHSHEPPVLFPTITTTPIYFLPHDLVNRLLLPLFLRLTPSPHQNTPSQRKNLTSLHRSLTELVDHILHWRDGHFELWDPWPFWWLYCVYWPCWFAFSLVMGRWWSRCNVGTGKMFRC
jgi:hypothetical protein